jgi:hypothetical protein
LMTTSTGPSTCSSHSGCDGRCRRSVGASGSASSPSRVWRPRMGAWPWRRARPPRRSRSA